VQQTAGVIEMNARPLSVHTSDEGWMRRLWDSVWPIGVGKLENQAVFSEDYRSKPGPILELGRVNGELVLMGRNQTMKMLLQDSCRRP